MARRASLAGTAWGRAHAHPGDEDAEGLERGPDLWDRRFNSEYMTVGDEPSGPAPLPDWETFEDRESLDQQPPLFAVEVEELPRGAAVEWHVHGGLSGLGPRTVQTGFSSGVSMIGDKGVRWRSHLMAVACGRQTCVHNVLSIEEDDGLAVTQEPEFLDSVYKTIWKDPVAAAGVGRNALGSAVVPQPYLVYRVLADGRPEKQPGGTLSRAVPSIPCRSIWTPGGSRVHALALFKYAI